MKCFKSILSILLTMTMILSVAAIPSFAATETSIKGEELIYLPGEDAVKIYYNLLDSDGSVVENGVTYSVLSEDENYKDWLDVDSETGEVFVKGDATGKTFTVKAESASYTAQKVVSTSQMVLSADFEDGTIPEWIYNDSAEISVKTNGNKKYLNVPANGASLNYPIIRLADKGINFVSDHMTYEMNYMISHLGSGAPNSPVAIQWEGAISDDSTISNTNWTMVVNSDTYDSANGKRQLFVTGAKRNNNNRIVIDSNKYNVGAPVSINSSWYNSSTNTFNEGFGFDALKIEVNGGAVKFTAGGSTTDFDVYKDIGMTFKSAAVKSVNLSGAIDDICIYTGERVEHEFNVVIVPKASLEGDDVLYLPGSGAIKVDYKLVAPDGADITDYVLYSVSSDDANQKDWLDVNRNTGEVYVKGDATGKTFTVTGTSADWSASKTVTISDEILYADFEDGQIPSWIYGDGVTVSVKDNNGNKYLNVPAADKWGAVKSVVRLKDQGMAIKTDNLSFEAKFMISDKKSGDGTYPHQPFAFIWDNNGESIGNGETTVSNTSWTMGVTAQPIAEDNTRQIRIPTVYRGKADDIVASTTVYHLVGDPIKVDPDWYNVETKTFNEGFEFASFKAEVADSVVYTVLNGKKNTFDNYKKFNLDINSADLVSIAMSGAFDDILIYTGKKVNYTFGIDPSTRSKIEGDCYLYLPGSDAVKLTYNLVDPEGNDVEGNVTYSISSEDADCNKWVEIDSETGVVHVKGDAFGKSFMVSATSSTYSASLIVEISETALKADFEDGKVPSWIYSDKVAVSVKDNNGNKYLNVPCAPGGNYGTITEVIRLKNQGKAVKSTHLSFETKFMVTTKNSGEGPYPHQPFNFVFENENGLAKKDAAVQVTNTSWAVPVSTKAYDAASSTKQLYLNGAWTDGTTVKKSDSVMNNIGSPIFIDSDWYSAETSSFNEGFEFASFKLEIEDGIVYTTVNGDKQPYEVYKNNHLDLNKGEFINAYLSGAFDDMVIYTGERTYYEFGIDPESRGTIKGDEVLYLPGNGAVKLQYGLISPDGAEVSEGVEYSVYSDEEGFESWLDMDEKTGELYIAGDALGKNFIVIARTDDCYASQRIETSKKVLSANFDDGKIPSWIYSDKVVVSVKDNNGNKYLNVPCASGGNYGSLTDVIRLNKQGMPIKTSHLSFESKFMVSHMTSGSGEHPHQPFTFKWENLDGIGKPGANISNTAWNMGILSKPIVNSTRQIYIPGAWNVNNTGVIREDSNVNAIGNPINVNEAWYDTETKSFISGFEFADFKAEVKGSVVYTTLNGERNTYTKYRDLNLDLNGAEFISVSMSGAFDDILIYTGEKVAHIFGEAAEIDGDSIIARAYPGTTAKLTYSVSYKSGTEIPATATWSLEEPFKGVRVSGTGANGYVYVDGDASAGTFTVNVENEGTLIAAKEIKISNKLSEWTNDKTRYSVNFEDQKVGDIPRPRLSDNYDDHSLVAGNKSSYNFSSKAEADAAGVEFKTYNSIVKEEANGNKYVSSTGYLHWSKDGATLTFNAKNSLAQGYPNILDDSKIATLEGRVMFESENIARLGLGTWSIFYQNGTAMNFDIRYGFLTKDQAFITLNMKDGKGEATARDVAYVPADEWIDVRVEFDNSDDTFDFYVNDVKVVENEKHSIPTLYSFFGIGCAVDDLVFYSGAKDAEEGTPEEFFKTFKDDAELSENTTEFVWNEATPAGGAAKVAAVILTEDDLSGKGIITAIYNSTGKLVAINVAEATKNDAGLSLAKSKIQTSVSAGSRAKIFLWDFESIKPIK